DHPIAYFNKAIAFMSAVVALRFPSTNNQLRTSSNLRNQATIQVGRVTVKQVQGRQGQCYARTGNKGNATSFGGNNTGGKARVLTCYNCQGEQHMASSDGQSFQLCSNVISKVHVMYRGRKRKNTRRCEAQTKKIT
ncbi:hypothetical protein Tco_0716163, partial [Tanacetum coccineum]